MIHNKEELTKFIDLLPSGLYPIYIFDRVKHGGKFELFKSELISRKNLLGQLEMYEQITNWNFNGEPIDKSTISVYINTGPIDEQETYFNMVSKVKSVVNDGHGLTKIINSSYKTTNGNFVHIDLDFLPGKGQVEEDVVYLKATKQRVYRTRGGYRLLIDPLWMSTVLKLVKVPNENYKVDQVGNLMMPIPGLTQGGFNVFEL